MQVTHIAVITYLRVVTVHADHKDYAYCPLFTVGLTNLDVSINVQKYTFNLSSQEMKIQPLLLK